MMLLGVIPGHPSDDNLNHYLNPVIDDMCDFWCGIIFSRTHAFDASRLVQAVLALVIADMLGLRLILEHGSSISTLFCTLCSLPV